MCENRLATVFTAIVHQGTSKCVILCIIPGSEVIVCEIVVSIGIQQNEAAVSTDHNPTGNKHCFSGLHIYYGIVSVMLG